MTFDPMSVEVICVTLPKDHCVQVPWQYINVDTVINFANYHIHIRTTYRMSDHIVSYWTQFRRDNYDFWNPWNDKIEPNWKSKNGSVTFFLVDSATLSAKLWDIALSVRELCPFDEEWDCALFCIEKHYATIWPHSSLPWIDCDLIMNFAFVWFNQSS